MIRETSDTRRDGEVQCLVPQLPRLDPQLREPFPVGIGSLHMGNASIPAGSARSPVDIFRSPEGSPQVRGDRHVPCGTRADPHGERLAERGIEPIPTENATIPKGNETFEAVHESGTG